MDELEIRRRLFADPNDSSQDVLDACEVNPKVESLKQELVEFDQELKKAFEIDAPENLAERILLNKQLKDKKRKSPFFSKHFAIAASIAGLFAITISLFSPFSERQTYIVEHALAHYMAEVDHIPTDESSTLSNLNSQLASFGASLSEQITAIGQIKFSSFCTFQGTRSLHIVFNDGERDVTVFVVPSNSGLLNQNESSIASFVGKNTRILDTDVVVISDNAPTTDTWINQIKGAIRWQKA